VTARVVAVDVGGTRIKAAVVSDGRAHGTTVTQVSDDASVLDQVIAIITSLRAPVPDAGIGVCVPGLVDQAGTLRSLPGKLAGLAGTDIAGRLRQHLGVAPVVTNDAVAFGIGEAVHGAGAGAERVVVVTIGTGVGVSLVDRSLPVAMWVRGTAALGGFIPISDRATGPSDSTGQHDTIEALCSAARIVDYARDAGADYGSVEKTLAAHARGETPAMRGVEEYRGHLARALTALAHAHMPDVVVVGGGPLREASPLLDRIEERVNQRLYADFTVAVRHAQLGDDAALVGLGVIVGAGRAPAR
jgi:glucokinase